MRMSSLICDLHPTLRSLRDFLSVGSGRFRNKRCLLETTKEGGTGYAKTNRQTGVLSSPTLAHCGRANANPIHVVLRLVALHIVATVTACPPASAGGHATFFFSVLPSCMDAVWHHLFARSLGSRRGTRREPKTAGFHAGIGVLPDPSSLEQRPSRTRGQGHAIFMMRAG